MKIEIKNRFNGSILFSIEADSWKIAVEMAVKAGADLRSADLSYANLSYANLRYANLRYADLSYADLSYANLSYANLRYANLRYADLSSADLSSADLSSADLRSADLSSAKNIPPIAIAQTRILPDGDIVGWKKCIGGTIVKLLIPSDAKRCHAFGRKCRAEFAKVLDIIGSSSAKSMYDMKTEYIIGGTVKCDKWDDDFTNECSGGIHFFITRLEAENYE